MYNLYRLILVSLTCLGFYSAPCRSELFYFPAVSPSAMGTSFASAPAGFEDITQQFFNPAVTAYFYDDQVAGVGSLLLSNDTFKNGNGLTFTGDEITGVGDPARVSPHMGGGALYGSYVLNKIFHLGVAITTPWRKKTTYAHDWTGRYYGTRLEMIGVNISPTLSWNIHDTFYFGIGPQFQSMSLKYEQAVDFGSLGQQLQIPGAVPGEQDGFMSVNGSNWGSGWVFGAAFEPCWYLRLGVSYRSRVCHKICASSRFELSEMGREVNNVTGQYSQARSPEIQLVTPSTIIGGIYYYHNECWEATGSIALREWEGSGDIIVDFGGNPDLNAVLAKSGWRNAPSVSAGVKYYHPVNDWYASLGGMYQDNPVERDAQMPLLFGSSNGSISLGWGCHYQGYIFFDAAWLHTFHTEISIDQDPSRKGNSQRGSLTGRVETKADILSASLTAEF